MNSISGSGYLVLSGLALALVNAGVKYLPHIPPFEILFFRAVISFALTYAALRRARLPVLGNNRVMLIVRGLAGTFGLWLYFYTLQTMPLASAVTIQYLYPILTGLVGAYFLKEHPSRLQWLLLAISFAGVLMVKGFDTRVGLVPLVLGLVSAAVTAGSMTVIRALRHEDHPLVVMFYLPLVSLVVLGPYTAAHWVEPRGWEWIVLLGMGVLTQIAQYWLTMAYHLDSAANIANLTYLGIVYALAIGILFFNEPVETLSLIGMGVIGLSAVASTRARNRVQKV